MHDEIKKIMSKIELNIGNSIIETLDENFRRAKFDLNISEEDCYNSDGRLYQINYIEHVEN